MVCGQADGEGMARDGRQCPTLQSPAKWGAKACAVCKRRHFTRVLHRVVVGCAGPGKGGRGRGRCSGPAVVANPFQQAATRADLLVEACENAGKAIFNTGADWHKRWAGWCNGQLDVARDGSWSVSLRYSIPAPGAWVAAAEAEGDYRHSPSHGFNKMADRKVGHFFLFSFFPIVLAFCPVVGWELRSYS